MIQFNNQNDWKIIQYQGHSIKAAYSNLGKVWEKESPVPPTPTFDGKFKIVFTDAGGSERVYSAICDATSAITSAETSGYLFNAKNIEIGKCVSSIDDRAFNAPQIVTSVTIGENVATIGNSSFFLCPKVPTLTIPNSVRTIGETAFSGWRSITELTIPSGVVSIGNQAFSQCSALTSVIIEGSTTFENLVFAMCSGLTSVTCLATTPPTVGFNMFYDTSNALTIYVPSASVNAYKTATNWSTYANRIQAIPNS